MDGYRFTTPVLAWALFSFTSVSLVMLGSMVWQIRGIPIGGEMSSAAVAVVPGAAELGWSGQIFVFMRACYPVPISLVLRASTTIHTWVDVELRVVGEHVAVNIKNPNRSWVHNLGPQTKGRPSFPGLVFSKMGSIRGVVLGHLGQN